MARETITIKATDDVRRLAQLACDIQDASNPSGVQAFLGDVMKHFRDYPNNGQSAAGSDMVAQNPVTVLTLCKLVDLARQTQSGFEESYNACLKLAAGTDVEWSVFFS